MSKPDAEDEELHQETRAYVNLVMRNIPATDKRLQEIKEAQQADLECKLITKYCHSGWPSKPKAPVCIRQYLPLSAEFSIQQDLLLRGSRNCDSPSPPKGPTITNTRRSSRNLQMQGACKSISLVARLVKAVGRSREELYRMLQGTTTESRTTDSNTSSQTSLAKDCYRFVPVEE